jgi:hypothetical protein
MVPPEKLLVFDSDEWSAEHWWQSAQQWGDARMSWVKAHPNTTVGSRLDVLREQHRLFEAHRRSEWEASLNGRAS